VIIVYIHERKNWPQFAWDQEHIANVLAQVRYQQGLLLGRMESIGFRICEETFLQTLTQDVVKSSEIEGEILDQELVRSSVARRLGIENAALDPVDRNIEGVVEMVLDATQRFDEPLTKERLLRWHATLFPNGGNNFTKVRAGVWRASHVEVLSGQMGKETVHFEGPKAALVDHEMKLFLDWCNAAQGGDFVLKAAIAHLWFVTIHPFEDGNGRIGRVIADMMLARSEKSPHRFYSLSAQIRKDRKSYYAILEQTQKGDVDITAWLEWFLACLKRALESALGTLDVIVQKAQFWEVFAAVSFNDRQWKIINYLLDGFEGKLTSSKWAKITKCSQDTAYRDILDLIERGILAKNVEGGRSTSYFLVPWDRHGDTREK